MEDFSNTEILDIITDNKDSHSQQEVKQAKLISEKRGLDVYLYVNDRAAFDRLSKKEKVVDNRASSRLRFVNLLVDGFVLMVIGFSVTFLIRSYGNLQWQSNLNNYSKLWSFLLTFGYYAIQEGLWNKTLGKIITGTTVVSLKDEKPSSKEILMRTACRFIPLEALSFLFMKDGFHDIFSNTKVIETRK